MPMIASTSAVVLDIQSMFDTPGEEKVTPAQALSGRFTQELVSTADYIIRLITYIGNEQENEPHCGVAYELELLSNAKKIPFDDVQSLLAYVKAYVEKEHQVTPVTFQINDGVSDAYQWVRKGVHSRRMLLLKAQNITVREVVEADDGRYAGFVRNTELDAFAASGVVCLV